SNPRPSGYEPDELPDCSTPRRSLCSSKERHERPVPSTSSIPPVRVAVVDIGTNSTRLLVADVNPSDGSIEEPVRRPPATRLGAGVSPSAAPDAATAPEFGERVREACGLEARVLKGEEEAELPSLGAMAGRAPA